MRGQMFERKCRNRGSQCFHLALFCSDINIRLPERDKIKEDDEAGERIKPPLLPFIILKFYNINVCFLRGDVYGNANERL